MASKRHRSPKQQAVLQFGLPAPRGSPCYQEISKLIVGPDGPPWLPDFLSSSAPGLALDRNVQALLPSRADMRKTLRGVGEAAVFMRSAVNEGSVRAFLEDNSRGPIPYHGWLDHFLGDLAARAVDAQESARLTNPKGKTKAGKGAAAPSNSFSPERYCALLIAELWHHFRSRYPGKRNRKAAQAAEMLWSATGTGRGGWGPDPLTVWEGRFQEIKTLKIAEKERSKIRRRLTEQARRWEARSSP
jgi:hypothetical protein